MDKVIATSPGWWSSSGVPGGAEIDSADGDGQSAAGAPRIHGELLKLGIDISERSVSRLLPPSSATITTWRTLLANHLDEIVSVDLLTVPTATFRILFCLVVLRYDRRRVMHFNVTEHPTAQWAAQQLVEAFPARASFPYFLWRHSYNLFCRSFRCSFSATLSIICPHAVIVTVLLHFARHEQGVVMSISRKYAMSPTVISGNLSDSEGSGMLVVSVVLFIRHGSDPSPASRAILPALAFQIRSGRYFNPKSSRAQSRHSQHIACGLSVYPMSGEVIQF